MRKAFNIVLSIAVMAMLGIVIIRPQIVDSAVLLENKHPGYTDWILNAVSEYVDEGTEGSGAYLLTNVVKDGFGAVEPDDIEYYLNYSRNLHPEMSRAMLLFDDGTGVEISDGNASYGAVDAEGRLVDTGVEIDLSQPLINQIEGLTRLEREYDERGNLVYQFRTDGSGNGVADEYGVAGIIREYDESGSAFGRIYDNIVSERYLGTDGQPTECVNGYSEVRFEYNDRRITKESYFNRYGNLTNISEYEYAYYVNEYDDNGDLALTYFYDKDGNYLKMGSSYFHEFLKSLKGKEFVVSIKDEGTFALTNMLMDDLRELGITSELMGKYRCSFYAVVKKDGVIEDLSQDRIDYNGDIDGKKLEVISSGGDSDSLSSILIDDIELSKNGRGMNFVVIEDGEVAESMTVDTFLRQMPFIR